MASKSETGHYKNVANLKTLNTYLESLGEKYNPSKKSIQLKLLTEQQEQAENVLNAIKNSFTGYSAAVDVQEAAFEPLDKFITRLVRAFKSSISNPAEAETAISIQNKIRGSKKGKIDISEETTPDGKDTISTSRRSYDSRLESFNQLISILAANEEYQPNEPEMQVASLEAMAARLKEKTEAVDKAATPLINNRFIRNELLYNPKSGLVSVSIKAIKDYVISVFGSGSPQIKYINTLSFSNLVR